MSKKPVEVHAAKLADSAVKKNSPLLYLQYAIVLIPALIYFSAVNTYNVNLPYQDDYDGVLRFLTTFKTLENPVDKFFWLFSQHGEHRILSARLMFLFDYLLFGKVNFIHLIFVSNLQLLVFYLLVTSFIRKSIPVYWSIVATIFGFCIFDLSSYENADFALSGSVNYGILLLFFASIYMYDSNVKWKNWVAVVLQIVCTFSSGAGILTSLCIVIFNFLKGDRAKLFMSIGALIVFAPMYFIHYEKVPPMGGVKNEFNIGYIARFFLKLVGGHFGTEYSFAAAIIMAGVLVWVLPVKFNLKTGIAISPNNIAFVCLFGYLLATFLVISLFRSNTVMGDLGAYQSRYLVNSHLLLGLIIVLAAIKLDGGKYFFYALAAGGIVCAVSYKSNYTYGEACLNMTKNRLEYYPYYYGSHKDADNEKAKAMEAAACKMGIYCISDER